MPVPEKRKMNETTKQSGRRLLGPLVSLLAALRISPNAVTVSALPLSIGAGCFFATGRFVWGGVLAALVGLCDTLDGELSRRTGTATAIATITISAVTNWRSVSCRPIRLV